jgi:hypothetical protein
MDFLIAISESPKLIPHQIQMVLTGNSILFLGYQLANWNSRIFPQYVIRHQTTSIHRPHLIQLLPVGNVVSVSKKKKAQHYAEKYFQGLSTQVYWGTCHDFIADLRRRWERLRDY